MSVHYNNNNLSFAAVYKSEDISYKNTLGVYDKI